MLLIAGRYARSVQAQLQTTGHLFEKRYHAVLVDADEYLLTLLRYIHLNPVRANLVSSPDDYPGPVTMRISERATSRGSQRHLHCACSTLIASERSSPTRRSSLVRTVSSPLTECNERDPRILGSDSFAHRF